MHRKIELLNRRLETIREKQYKNLEVKYILCKIKNSLDGLNNKID